MTEDKIKKRYEKISLGVGTLLAPVPVVMVSCGSKKDAEWQTNIITIAWTGIINSKPPMLSISIRSNRYSYELIKASKEFVVNLVNEELLKACDYCGVKSGLQINKFEACQLTAVKAENLKEAPAILESPLSISCQVKEIKPLGSHDLFIAEIVAVQAQKSLLTAKNELNLMKADLVTYQHGSYFQIGKKLGFFGYSVAKPKVLKRRLRKK